MTPEDAWQETCHKTPAHLYEVLTGPCHFYLDIEWKCKVQPCASDEHSVVDTIVAAARSKVEEALSTRVNEARVTASGILPCGSYKCSWHVHLYSDTVSWTGAYAVGRFVSAHLSHFPQVDMSPYKGSKQNWRCVGSAKATDPSRCLKPVSRDTFMKCLVQPHNAHMRLVGDDAPSRSIVPTVGHAVDSIVAMFPGVRQASVQWAVPGRFLVLPFVSKHCPIAGREHTSNHQYAIVDVRAMRWRHKCHNTQCASAPSYWQAMPDFQAGKTLLCGICTPPSRDFALSQTRPSLVAMRARGPPPLEVLRSNAAVRCINGTFAYNGK